MAACIPCNSTSNKQMNSFCFVCKQKNTSIRQNLHCTCNAKCIYKYQAQEVKMKDTKLTNMDTVKCNVSIELLFFAPAFLDILLILKFNCP